MKSNSKGKNSRCASSMYVGGVPTLPSESIWALASGVAVKVKSPKQITSPQVLLVQPSHLQPPDASLFTNPHLRPANTWAATTNPNEMLRSGARRGSSTTTISTYPHLRSRLNATAIYATPRLDPLSKSPDGSLVMNLAERISHVGGRALVVGGSVRDAAVAFDSGNHVVNKDVDVEVFGVDAGTLRGLLSRYGVEEVGVAFSVFKLRGSAVDVSLPRTEAKTGVGHKAFEVTADPKLPPARAALRRDFTLNAMMFDPLTGELVDPTGGLADLRSRTLRHVSDQFAEDPLRVLRAAQFISRFDLTVAPATASLCASLLAEGPTLPQERVFEEFTKMLVKGDNPGSGLRFLDQVGWLSLWPELSAQSGVALGPDHLEGDALAHTAKVLDSLALIRPLAADPMVLGMAALLVQASPKGVTDLTKRLSNQPKLTSQVTGAVVASRGLRVDLKDHELLALAEVNGGLKAPTLLRQVDDLAHGVNPARWNPVLDKVTELEVETSKAPELVRGEDCLALGVKPGKGVGELLRKVRSEQLSGRVSTRYEGMALLVSLVAS